MKLVIFKEERCIGREESNLQIRYDKTYQNQIKA